MNLLAFGAFRLLFYDLLPHFTDGAAGDVSVPRVAHDFPVLRGLSLLAVPHPVQEVQRQPCNTTSSQCCMHQLALTSIQSSYLQNE